MAESADPTVKPSDPAYPTPSRSSGFFKNVQMCTAHNRQGDLCGRPAIAGGTVCRFHGGAAGAVKRKAEMRLQELVTPALAVITRIMADNNARDADRLRAAENILDRAGFVRGMAVETDTGRELLLEQLLAIQAGMAATSVDTDDTDDNTDSDDGDVIAGEVEQ